MSKNLNSKIIMTFERMFGSAYSIREKYFYFLLRELWFSKKSPEGWIFLSDNSKSREQEGFGVYGLSTRICKSARKKLKRDDLLEYRYAHGDRGYRIGTEYRLLDRKFIANSKTVHADIMGRLSERVIHLTQITQ